MLNRYLVSLWPVSLNNRVFLKVTGLFGANKRIIIWDTRCRGLRINAPMPLAITTTISLCGGKKEKQSGWCTVERNGTEDTMAARKRLK